MRNNRLNSLEKPSTCLFPHSISAIRLLFMNYGLINRIIYLLRSEGKCHMIFPFQLVPTFRLTSSTSETLTSMIISPKIMKQLNTAISTRKAETRHPHPDSQAKSSGMDIRKYRWTVSITCQLQKQSHTNQFHRHWLWRLPGSCTFSEKLKELFSNEEFDLIAIESWSHNASAIRNYAKRKDLNYTILNATNEVIKQYQTGGAAPFFSYWTRNESYEK